jgi:sulfate adenylyltransferase subunit 2
VVGYVEDSIKKYNLKETGGRFPSRNSLQTYTLLDTIEENEFDACIGVQEETKKKPELKKEFSL